MHNRIINISDINMNLEKAIKENIRKRWDQNLYLDYQKKHKKLELSLYQSVEEDYETREGRYSPEIRLNTYQ